MNKRLTVRGSVSQRDIDKLLDLTNENQFGRNEAYYKLQCYEDLEELLLKQYDKIAILVELDYKASYIRYALTFQEFFDRFKSRLLEDMPCPEIASNAYTIRPLVHVWYKITTIGSPEWDEFFTDMSSGLPDSDINDGNLAYIEYDYMDKLVTDVNNTVEKYGKEKLIWDNV